MPDMKTTLALLRNGWQLKQGDLTLAYDGEWLKLYNGAILQRKWALTEAGLTDALELVERLRKSTGVF